MAARLLGAVPAAHATYVGDNGKIAFNTASGGAPPIDIWVINPDGSGLQLLWTGGGSPGWSPDGRKVAYGCPAPDATSMHCECGWSRL